MLKVTYWGMPVYPACQLKQGDAGTVGNQKAGRKNPAGSKERNDEA
jgi:hypothetical protein